MRKALKKDWPAEVTLTPYSGIQFLDFGFDESAGGQSFRFSERLNVEGEEELWSLWPRTGDAEIDSHIPPRTHESETEHYDINRRQALEPFVGKWTPVPLLRIAEGRGPGGREIYEKGPSTWARMMLVPIEEAEQGGDDDEITDTHHLILAIDTDLDTLPPPEGAPYLTPLREDAENEREFRLVGALNEVAWFVSREIDDGTGELIDVQDWVSRWTQEQFDAVLRAKTRKGDSIDKKKPHKFEHWARYLAMLQMIAKALTLPKIRLLNTVSEYDHRDIVNVDLVLDIGNSRTCGILVESHPTEARVDLKDCYALALRDIGAPDQIDSRPFESRVEFAHASFGPEDIARFSGRTRPAFQWPSIVRTGQEAARLLRSAEGTETTSGLSSPKRYVWDAEPSPQEWRINGIDWRRGTLPRGVRAIFADVTDDGDVIAQIKADVDKGLREEPTASPKPSIRPRFSRSALYGLLISEITAHAVMQINDVEGRLSRKNAELPRRLRNVILTLPSATPLQEQAIMRSRAEGAVRLLWSVSGHDKANSRTTNTPKVKVDWDEATCTQLVWIFDQITERMGGQIRDFFDLAGRKRAYPLPEGRDAREARQRAPMREGPSLRVGCIDIGGGTTDLMITTYYADADRMLHPAQNVREGFRVAGDDLLFKVVQQIVLPALEERLAEAGARDAATLVRQLFTESSGDADERQRQLRRRFGLQVLTPIGLAVLEAAETGETARVRALDAVGATPVDPYAAPDEEDARPRLALEPAILSYLETAAAERGAAGFRLEDFEITVTADAVATAVRDSLGGSLSAMLELVAHLDVDVLLLSGRPTKQPAVLDLVRESLAVAPHRIVPMHGYRVGAWYPYRDRLNARIGDPKTTAAVGSVLCNLAKSSIANFHVDTSAIQMRSTALYIGELESGDRILAERVLFETQRIDRGQRGAERETIRLHGPRYFGFRQLPHERWPATPLYRLDFAPGGSDDKLAPFDVTIMRWEDAGDRHNEDAGERLKAETLREAYKVEEVQDSSGAGRLNTEVRLTLHTLGISGDDYWLDTGVFVGN